jgi:phosphate transport system substrate-binding protein
MHRFRRAALALLAGTLLSALVPLSALASSTSLISISGATASYPLILQLAQKYQKLNHHVRIKLTQGGSSVGINDVTNGSVTIGDLSRDPLEAELKAGLVFNPVAKYYLCVVTNKTNPISNLTQAQVEAIFTGKVREWSQVSGATAKGPIDVISRASGAGTLTNFETLLIGGKKVLSTAAQEPSEGLQQQQVKNDPGAIGFLSGYLADKGVNPVGFNGVGCTLANSISGQYVGVGRFYEVTKGKATGAAEAFISWIDKSKAARKIISTQWIPV